MPRTIITIGTRQSKLALWQAESVKRLIQNKFKISVTLKKIVTEGDRQLDRPLFDSGGKGLFLKEIEEELLRGSIDAAVHSMKDVPYDLSSHFIIAAVIRRGDPFDVFVSHDQKTPQELSQGAVVGTSSPRRTMQLKKKFPHLEFKILRGNVESRLKKLDNAEYDAVVLAKAGLERLGYHDRIGHVLNIVPAVGQGAIGVECRTDNSRMIEWIKPLSDPVTEKCVSLEREFCQKMQGTCDTPIGCHVRSHPEDAKKFIMDCFWSRPDGSGYFEKRLSDLWSRAEGMIDDITRQWLHPMD